jgi:hypothetical protein
MILRTAYPHPYSPSRDGTLRIPIDVSGSTQALMFVYDFLGRRVATLIDGEIPTGSHAFAFNGAKLPRGMYSLVLISRLSTQIQQFILE